MANEDLSQTISSLLANPQTMQMLQGLMGALSGGGNSGGGNNSNGNGGNSGGINAQALQGLMGALSGGGNSGGGADSGNGNGGINAQALQGLMGMLGGNVQAQNPPPETQGESSAPDDTPPNPNTGSSGPSFDPSLLVKMQKAMSMLQQDDPRLHFLVALKPNLSEHRRHRVDEAVRILRLLNLVPLLREQHLL